MNDLTVKQVFCSTYMYVACSTKVCGLCETWLTVSVLAKHCTLLQFHATALMMAAVEGHGETVKALIEAGADPNTQDTVCTNTICGRSM